MNIKSEQINVDTNAQLIEEASRKMEQKNEESEILQLKSEMLEIEARLFNRKMRRGHTSSIVRSHGKFEAKERTLK